MRFLSASTAQNHLIFIYSRKSCFVFLRNKLQQQSSQLEALERQKAEINDLQQVSLHLFALFSVSCFNGFDFYPESSLKQQHNQDLGIQLGALSRSEGELTDANQRLRETLDRVREEARATRAQAERSQHEAERCGLLALCRFLCVSTSLRVCVAPPAGWWRIGGSSGWRRNTGCRSENRSYSRNTLRLKRSCREQQWLRRRLAFKSEHVGSFRHCR